MTNLVYVDLETGGIPVSTGIYEVGLVATEFGRIVDTLTIGLPINPSRFSEGMGQGYACISDDEVYIKQFKDFVAKHPYPFVAHNADFDKSFLVHYGWVAPNAIFYDTLARFRTIIPKTQIANYKLGTIMEYYGVQPEGTLHTALADLKGLVQATNAAYMFGDFGDAELEDIDSDLYDDIEDDTLSAVAPSAQEQGTKFFMHYYHPHTEVDPRNAKYLATSMLNQLLGAYSFKILEQSTDEADVQEVKTYLEIVAPRAEVERIMQNRMYQIYQP